MIRLRHAERAYYKLGHDAAAVLGVSVIESKFVVGWPLAANPDYVRNNQRGGSLAWIPDKRRVLT